MSEGVSQVPPAASVESETRLGRIGRYVSLTRNVGGVAANRKGALCSSTCSACGRHIGASGRICPLCGALTGVHNEPAVSPLRLMAGLMIVLMVVLMIVLMVIRLASLVQGWIDALP